MSELALRLIAENQKTRDPHLDLGNCGLSELPEELFECTWLESLILGDWGFCWGEEKLFFLYTASQNKGKRNDFSQLPDRWVALQGLVFLAFPGTQVSDLSPLAKLSQLQRLNCSRTQVSDLGPLAELSHLETLGCDSTQVSDLSPLAKLSQLKRLNCDRTQVSDLSPLAKLSQLQRLDCDRTQVSDLSPLAKLSQLQRLACQSTQVSDLLPLAALKNLRFLYLDTCQIRQLDAVGIVLNANPKLMHLSLYGNPIPHIPEGLLGSRERENVLEAVRAYLQASEDQRRIYEAKVILVGNGETGKTSVLKKLADNAYVAARGKTASTEGIAVAHLPAEIDSLGSTVQARLNVWDFSGQEIDYSTHQFFLTRNALYLFVFNSRKNDEENNFAYWLNIIRSLSPGSPVVGVMNRFDQQQQLFSEAQWKQLYPEVRHFVQVDCGEAGNEGIRRLWEEIRHQVKNLGVFGVDWPEPYARVRARLEQLASTKPYISAEKYREICAEEGIHEINTQEQLARFLGDIGSILYYPDALPHLSATENELLAEHLFLDSAWATRAVYLLVRDNEQTIRSHAASFDRTQLQAYWRQYETRVHKILLALVKRFDLCFQVEQEERYILPQLLSAERPAAARLDGEERLRFRLVYEGVMPKGIITRLICKQHKRIKQLDGAYVYWRDGVVLGYEGVCEALIYKRYDRDFIEIEIAGSRRRDFLAIIRETFEQIHEPLNRLQPLEMVGCTCPRCASHEDPQYFKYSTLLKKLESRRYETELCEKSDNDVNIQQLLANYTLSEFELLRNIRYLIEQDRLEEAIFRLPGDRGTMLKSEFSRLRDAHIKGTLSKEDYVLRRNQLAERVLMSIERELHFI